MTPTKELLMFVVNSAGNGEFCRGDEVVKTLFELYKKERERKMTNLEYLFKKTGRVYTDTKNKKISLKLNDIGYEYLEKNFLEKEVSTDWFLAEYKAPIKLTKQQYYFLKSIDKSFEWIAKDERGAIWVYHEKPVKDINCWTDKKEDNCFECVNLYVYQKGTFDFLSWEDEEPTNIQELLQNCEVVEDES